MYSTLRNCSLGFILLGMGLSTPAFAVLPDGVQDVTASMANNTSTLLSFVSGFTHSNTCGFNMAQDPAGGADGYYYETVSTTGADFTVSADNSTVATFDLTALSFTNFSPTASYAFTITGTKADTTTVQTTFAAQSNQIFTPGSYGAFTGLTKFRVQFDSTSSNSVSNITFDSFTIANAAAPVSNTAPTIGGTAAGYTSNDTATVSPFPAVTIGDADGDNVTTIVTLDTNAKGVFTPASLTASGFTGTGPYTLAATTVANAQTKIRQLVFDPADNRVASTTTETTTFIISVDDGTATAVTDNTTTVIATSVNDAPTITSNGGGASAAVNAVENQSAVTTVTSSDVDPGDSATYSISGGIDAAKFSIVGATGVLTFVAPPNFEAPTDAGTNNVYDVQVTVTDGGPLTDVQSIAVTVINVNENPVITSNGGGATASINAAENQSAVTTVMAADVDAATTITYSISGGADQALFNINSGTGVLTFSVAPNYESPNDSGANGVYDVQVTVTDNGAGLLTDVQSIAVTVTNVNEAPVITSNGGGAIAALNAVEGQTAVTTVTATDVDAATTITYSITGGADADKFNIVGATGVLTFTAAPNFDVPTDVDANNIYDVQVTASDNGAGTLTDVQSIVVTVTNVNVNPVITSNGGGTSAALNAAENQSAVTTVVASDQDATDTVSYSVTGGVDQTKFSIVSATGVLSFTDAPNFEAPTDVGANNVYDVQVTATDNGTGNLTDVQSIAVTVTNVNEAPVITSNGGGATAATWMNENTTAVTTVTATDVDSGDTLTYSISGGADVAKFSIVGATGVLSFISAPDFESPGDSGADNVYDVQVTVTDSGTGNLTDSQAIAVTVLGVNEAPVITGQAALTTQVDTTLTVTLADLTVTDPDNSYPTGFTLSLQGGANYSLSGNIVIPAPGYIGNLTVPATVNDGTNNSAVFNLLVTVTVGNTAPAIGGTPTTGVGDDVPYSFVPTASDADAGDTLTFSIINKPSWAIFDSASGALTGTPASSNIGTTSGIVISVSDGLLTASLSAFDLKVFADNDNDNISDLLDPDDDNDGMTDVWELANGLDPLDPNDASTDSDGDGVSNLDEYTATTDPQADDYTPVVTAPADVNIDATGLYTAVDVGTGSANDGLDGAVTATSNASSHFAPGVHIVTWSATDAAGNTGTATQNVNIVPLVNLSIDQTAREGDIITIKAILNGDPVAYPVDVPYTVSGSADGSDHDLVNGIITINSPDLEATSAGIALADDGAGEGDETLILTMGVPTNAVPGSNTVHTTTITEINVDPEVELKANQGSGTTTLVAQADGSVIVTADVSDTVGDTFSYDWTATDNALIDTDGVADDATFSFDPALLQPGVYTLRATVADDQGGSSEADLILNVVASAPVLTTTDTDGDGSNDDTEGHGDDDNDGIANYLDHGSLSNNVIPGKNGKADQFLMEAESGLKIRVGKVAFRAGKDSTNVNENDVTIHANDGAGAIADSLHDYDSGMFDFIINKLPSAGRSVRVVFAQHAGIPANAIYRKYANGVWQDFVEDDNNSLASATGAEGYCPPPGDAAYTAGLTEGDWCVQLTIEDGGPNDADGKANRSIADPGGVTEAALIAEPVPTDDPDHKYSVLNRAFGGSVSPIWLFMVVGLLAARRLQGRKTH